MEIVLDFDGTCVTHEYPSIGKEIGAERVLSRLIEKNHKLILFTMRGGEYLKEAVEWFEQRNIPLYGVQKNPTQDQWTDSPKAYGQIIIDDAALGCPLVFDESISNRPFVDWEEIESILEYRGLFGFNEIK